MAFGRHLYQIYILIWFIRSHTKSTISLKNVILVRHVIDLKPISETLGMRHEYTLDGMPVQCRASCTHSHTLIHIFGQFHIHKSMFSGSGAPVF